VVVFSPGMGIKLNERIQLDEATWPKFEKFAGNPGMCWKELL